MTLAERIREANSEQAWADAQQDMGEAHWAKTEEKRARIRAACDKAAQLADANPRWTSVAQIAGLTGAERELVMTRLAAR